MDKKAGTLTNVRSHLHTLADPERARALQKYFKTGKGEYGEGDIFIGLRVPELRACAKLFRGTPPEEAVTLLRSPVHEERSIALMLLVAMFEKGDALLREHIYTMYLANTEYINNWDLVDGSAPQIVGGYLADKSRKPLYTLATSKSLWERRIAILATYYFIRQRDFADTFAIAELLLGDTHDLIHKAVGWMLREVGNRNREAEEKFLVQHYKTMPRTMLRYAIEKFPEDLRKQYLLGMV